MKNGSTRNKNGNDISASLMLYFAYLKFIMLFGWCEKVKYFFVDTKTQLSLVIRKFETEMIIFLLLIYVMKNKLFSRSSIGEKKRHIWNTFLYPLGDIFPWVETTFCNIYQYFGMCTFIFLAYRIGRQPHIPFLHIIVYFFYLCFLIVWNDKLFHSFYYQGFF
jgi:hypothetical protein